MKAKLTAKINKAVEKLTMCSTTSRMFGFSSAELLSAITHFCQGPEKCTSGKKCRSLDMRTPVVNYCSFMQEILQNTAKYKLSLFCEWQQKCLKNAKRYFTTFLKVLDSPL